LLVLPSLSVSEVLAQKKMLMTIDAAIKDMEPIRTISGLILTPWVSSLKKVRRPALDAGIGALFFLLLIRIPQAPTVLKRSGLGIPCETYTSGDIYPR
jgi:hypothetical protein